MQNIPNNVYNIGPAIIDLANTLNLEAIATGGNCDFICKTFGKGEDAPIVLIGHREDCGWCPDSADDLATAVLYPRGLNDYESAIMLELGTMRETMQWLSKLSVVPMYTLKN